MDLRLPSTRKSVSASVASSDSANRAAGAAPSKQARTFSVERSESMATVYLCRRSAAAVPAASNSRAAARTIVRRNIAEADCCLVARIRKTSRCHVTPGFCIGGRARKFDLRDRLRGEFGARLVRKIGREPAFDFLQ